MYFLVHGNTKCQFYLVCLPIQESPSPQEVTGLLSWSHWQNCCQRCWSNGSEDRFSESTDPANDPVLLWCNETCKSFLWVTAQLLAWTATTLISSIRKGLGNTPFHTKRSYEFFPLFFPVEGIFWHTVFIPFPTFPIMFLIAQRKWETLSDCLPPSKLIYYQKLRKIFPEITKPICGIFINKEQSPQATIRSSQRAVLSDVWHCLSLVIAACGILLLAPDVKAGVTLTLAHLKLIYKGLWVTWQIKASFMHGSVSYKTLVPHVSCKPFFIPHWHHREIWAHQVGHHGCFKDKHSLGWSRRSVYCGRIRFALIFLTILALDSSRWMHGGVMLLDTGS